MRLRAALLLVTPLLACFADGGATTVVSSAGLTDPVDTGSTSSGTGTSTTTEATTAGPTTAGPTTEGPTTAGPTTEGPTTGAPGNCQLAPECEVGAVETGAQCDGCGVQRRTCQADCTWTPMSCEQDLDTCAYWVLPAGEQAWQRVAVDPAAQFAPKETVLAAIALAPQQLIYVLTASSYHVLSTTTRTWVDAGPRDVLFPQFAGLPVIQASEIDANPPDTVINIIAGAEVFAYTYLGDQGTLKFDAQVACCGPDWEGPDAPPDPAAIRDGWGKRGNEEAWIPGDVWSLCPEIMIDEFYAYNVAIGDGFVYPQDIGYCFEFYPPIPYDQFPPFTYPGRPDNYMIGGAGWVDGLWIFRGE